MREGASGASIGAMGGDGGGLGVWAGVDSGEYAGDGSRSSELLGGVCVCRAGGGGAGDGGCIGRAGVWKAPRRIEDVAGTAVAVVLDCCCGCFGCCCRELHGLGVVVAG